MAYFDHDNNSIQYTYYPYSVIKSQSQSTIVEQLCSGNKMADVSKCLHEQLTISLF